MKFLTDLLLKHEGKAVFFCSSGKDSAMLFHMLESGGYLDRIHVVWLDTGAAHPRTQAYMAGIERRAASFEVLRTNQPADIAANGWPADVVPVKSTVHAMQMSGERPITFRSYMECCFNNIWAPLAGFIADRGYTLLIYAQRGDEQARNRGRDGFLIERGDVTFLQPLHYITQDQVYTYLRKHKVPLPPFYEIEGNHSSGDCWNCTAYLDYNRARLRDMQSNEPDRWSKIENILYHLEEETVRDTAALFEVVRRRS